jgi:hypothetical protein
VNCGSGEATLPGTKYSFDRGLSKEDILIHIYFILFCFILFYFIIGKMAEWLLHQFGRLVPIKDCWFKSNFFRIFYQWCSHWYEVLLSKRAGALLCLLRKHVICFASTASYASKQSPQRKQS